MMRIPFKRTRLLVVAIALLLAVIPAGGQTIQELDTAWRQANDALDRRDHARARTLYEDFRGKVLGYVRSRGITWQVQYLVGSLQCRFSETRDSGARFLRELLKNSRELSSSSEDRVRRLLTACERRAAVRDTPDAPLIAVASSPVHFQSPRVHGDMKSGYRYRTESESSVAVAPKSAAELRARRAQPGQSDAALRGALARLARGHAGAVVSNFVVVTKRSSEDATRVGRCLEPYLPALRSQFGIEAPAEMITVYVVESPAEVYALAPVLHGLTLPQGVVAYSVGDDLSLVGVGDPSACGSLAHELVHLLIKDHIPSTPAWLEEGLASEVAVAASTSSGLRFRRSWRDDILRELFRQRPSVAMLVEMSWSGLNSRAGEIGPEKGIAAQAMAAVFIRYLDAKKQLRPIYSDMHRRAFTDDVTTFVTDDELLARHLGGDLRAVDADFVKWFNADVGR
jgi:hypothetical protein